MPNQPTQPPRRSTETDRQHLLASQTNTPLRGRSPAASTITSRTRYPSTSTTIRAHSPSISTLRSPSIAPTTASTLRAPSPQPYRGFKSEAHYLAALNAWAESKKYLEPGDYQLVGFYGEKSSEDYTRGKEPLGLGSGLGLRRKWRARAARKGNGNGEVGVGAGGARRGTV